jgi:rubrerythrin
VNATRRQLLLLAASAAPALLRTSTAVAKGTDQVAVLESAIRLEQESAFAYAAIAESERAGELAPIARVFAEQEQEHADALGRALRDRGTSPPPKPVDEAGVAGLARALAGDAREIAAFAVELENRALAAYYVAHARLEAPELLSTVASIMGNEAQHLVVLRQELGSTPVTDAFVTGRLRPGPA